MNERAGWVDDVMQRFLDWRQKPVGVALLVPVKGFWGVDFVRLDIVQIDAMTREELRAEIRRQVDVDAAPQWTPTTDG